MHDPELMLSLLQEMEDDPIDRIHIGSDGRQEYNRFQHAELLVEEGHAAWCNNHKTMLRITQAGRRHLNDLGRHPEAKHTFLELLKMGASYATAAEKAAEIVSKLKSLL